MIKTSTIIITVDTENKTCIHTVEGQLPNGLLLSILPVITKKIHLDVLDEITREMIEEICNGKLVVSDDILKHIQDRVESYLAAEKMLFENN